MRMKLFAAAIAGTFIAGSALAADLPSRAEPPVYIPPPVATWTGFYTGVNAGVGWSNESFVTSVPGAPNTLFTAPFDGSLGWGANLPGSSRIGFTGGGQVGYNYQISQIVLGIETDFQYYGPPVSNNTSFVSTTPPGTTGLVTNHVNSSTPWFGTVRGRLGTTAITPSLLVYATGGLAYGRENTTDAMSTTNAGGALDETFPFSTSATKLGYTVGGGLEYMFAPNWSVKAEYLYVNLRANSGQTLATTTLTPSALATDIMTFNSSRDVLNIARLGINYKFGWAPPPPPVPVVAKY
ncbi:MAG: outer membrane protein [Beijerinckiaceae bacterium]